MQTGLASLIITGLIVPLAAGATPAASVTPSPTPAPVTAGLPGLQRELQCVKTAIKEIGSRLLDMPGSGSAVSYTNGGFSKSATRNCPRSAGPASAILFSCA